MSFPLAHTVQRLPYQGGATDSHGNPIDSWSTGVDERVYGWASPTSDEPKLAGHDRVVVDVEMFAQPDSAASPHDKYVVNGKTYSVEGEPENYNHGPFGWKPGVVVNLRRIEG